LALVSDRTPAIPAMNATTNDSSSGCETKLVSGWSDGPKWSGNWPIAVSAVVKT
jgi:hypothetical protein